MYIPGRGFLNSNKLGFSVVCERGTQLFTRLIYPPLKVNIFSQISKFFSVDI